MLPQTLEMRDLKLNLIYTELTPNEREVYIEQMCRLYLNRKIYIIRLSLLFYIGISKQLQVHFILQGKILMVMIF